MAHEHQELARGAAEAIAKGHTNLVISSKASFSRISALTAAELSKSGRQVLLVCGNLQIARQSTAFLESLNGYSDVGSPGEHRQIDVGSVSDQQVTPALASEYDVVVIDDFQEDQFFRMSAVTRSVRSSHGSVVQIAPPWMTHLVKGAAVLEMDVLGKVEMSESAASPGIAEIIEHALPPGKYGVKNHGILVDGVVQPCTLPEMFEWAIKSGLTVVQIDRYESGGALVSTVFNPGLLLRGDGSLASLFETFISDPDGGIVYQKYQTIEEARAGHASAVAGVTSGPRF